MRQRWRGLATAAVTLSLLGCADGSASQHNASDAPDRLEAAGDAPARATWVSSGNGVDNTRSQPGERVIGPETAKTLALKWTFTPKGDVWATPAVDLTHVYAPDSLGNLYAIDRVTGKQTWATTVATYTGVANDFARTTPALDGNSLFLGNQIGRTATVGSATVFAVDKRTGAKLWATKVDPHPAAIITASPVVYGDRVYVGISSYEEFRAPGAYQCCSFRGSVIALDKKTGAVVWKTFMTPDLPGFTGVAVWSSSPVVDAQRGSLYVTTGNNYGVPKGVLDCQALPTPDQIATCTMEVPGAEQNYFDSVLSLDLATGKVKWVHRAAVFDAFTVACILPGSPECTKPFGKDTDFGQGAILYTAKVGGVSRQLLGAGQKSGVYWALDPSNGEVVWRTEVGPGGVLGGLEWGSATDQTRIYTAIANSDSVPWTLPTEGQTRSGFWSGLDAATGKIAWATRGKPQITSGNRGAVSTANGVMFGGTFDGNGTLYALDGATGNTLWTYRSGGTIVAAPAIADGTLYWSVGYGTLGGIGGKKLLAFAPTGEPPVDCPDPEDEGEDDDDEPPAAGTFGAIWANYFGPATMGHCANCHGEMASAASSHAFLTAAGQLSGTTSKLVVPGQSRLTWFGGTMPPGGPASYPEAASDLKAWVAAGAKND